MLLVDCSLETEKKRRYFEKRRRQVYALRGCMCYRDTNFTVEPPRKRTPKGTKVSPYRVVYVIKKDYNPITFVQTLKGQIQASASQGCSSYRGYNFTVKPDKINFRFHRIWENTGKNRVMRKISFCEIWSFWSFSGFHESFFFRVISYNLLHL